MTPNIVKGSNSLPKDRFDDPNHPKNNPAFQPNTSDSSNSSSNTMSDSSIDAKNKASGVGSSSLSGQMDGDHSAKSMDAGANAATNVTDLADGIHEDSRKKVPFSHSCVAQHTVYLHTPIPPRPLAALQYALSTQNTHIPC